MLLQEVWENLYQEEYTVFAIAPICLIIMLYSYTCIYCRIHRRRVPGIQQQSGTRRESRRNTKALVTTLFALGSFIIAWLPLCLFQVTFIVKAYTDRDYVIAHQRTIQIVDRYLYNLLVLNSVVDPIIYTVRIREVKVGFQRIFCANSCSPNNSIERNASIRSRSSRPMTSYIMTTNILMKDTDLWAHTTAVTCIQIYHHLLSLTRTVGLKACDYNDETYRKLVAYQKTVAITHPVA